MKQYHYILTASQLRGSTVQFKAETKKEVLEQFDREYKRDGFQIVIDDSAGLSATVIKNSYK